MKKFIFLVALVSFFAVSRSALAYEEASKVQRSVADILKQFPELRKHVDQAMELFRAKEQCGTSNESKRPKGSKACTDLFTYDKAQAASAAELKTCLAKCNLGAASSMAATKGKGQDVALAKCVDDACTDECTQKDDLFKLDLDHSIKGSLGESMQMKEWETKRGAYIWMNK